MDRDITDHYESPAQGIDQPACPRPLHAGLRLLVVEDNAFTRKLLGAIFDALGWQVQMAEDGACGLDAAREGQFDLILTDLQMPRIDGLELIERVRAGDAGPAGIPIVLLTAADLDSVGDRLERAGATGILSKPIQPAVLRRAIEQALEAA